MKQPSMLSASLFIPLVEKCRNDQDGGYGGNVGFPSHVLYTFSALQIMALAGITLVEEDVSKTVDFLLQRINATTGEIYGDAFCMPDTRFSYCVLAGLHLLGALERVDESLRDRIAAHLLCCQGDDGGFGMTPFAESHGGQTFCVVASLSILGKLDKIDKNSLHSWLQLRSWKKKEKDEFEHGPAEKAGGFHGRSCKPPDSCYSWWIGACFVILGFVESNTSHFSCSSVQFFFFFLWLVYYCGFDF
eukprot:m.80346 g.80346  ORF g.80346 m.80346 type:complete len:246 (-) comp8620_c0_seq20:1647-2384(-)